MKILTPENLDDFLNSLHAKRIVEDFYYVVQGLNNFYILNLVDETVPDCGDHNPRFILATQTFFASRGPSTNSSILYSSKDAYNNHKAASKNTFYALSSDEVTWSEHKDRAMLLTLRKALKIIHNEGKMVYAYQAISDMAELAALFKSKFRY